MKFLLILWVILFAIFFVFGKVTVNEKYNATIIMRAIVCVISSLITALMIGLPILGIISLF